MALFKILHGDDSNISLDVTPFHEGWAYLTHGGNLYVDLNIGTVESPNNQRIKLNAANAETLCGMTLEELKADIASQNIVVLSEAQAYVDQKISELELQGGSGEANIVVDSELSITSTNPVQNKVITEAFTEAVEGIGGAIEVLASRVPPEVGTSENGKVLTVVDGQWQAADAPSGGTSEMAVPSFDLVEMGLTTLAVGGNAQLLTDTTQIMAALDQGPVKFKMKVNLGEPDDVIVSVLMNGAGADNVYFCTCTLVIDAAIYFTLMVLDGAVIAVASLAGEGGGNITVDAELSTTSENPVQNKVITEAFNDALSGIENTLGAMLPRMTPDVTTNDNGKIMQVVNGQWQAVSIADSAIKTYIDSYIGAILGGDY